MSLATNIKEFADVLHNIYAQQLTALEGTDMVSDGVLPLAIPKIVVFQQACLYGAKSFGEALFYFLSFQWLRDFSYFPLSAPEITHESSINHDTFLSSPFSYLFSFAKNGVALSSYTEASKASSLGLGESLYVKENFYGLFNGFFKADQLLAGFVNSFFFSLPFSLPHLITLRRMFSQGIAAAAASILGTIIAHSLVLAGVIYGIRFLIVPYYSLQPLTFFIGLVTIAIIITEFVKEKRVYLVPLTHYPSLIRIGVLNFVVALCESATVFHDLHHLTLNRQITYLQLYESKNAFDSFFMNLVYLMAFVLGHALFSLLFSYLILKAAEKMCSFTGWTLPQTARRMNRTLLVAILTLTFSSFPYYGLDYLFTKGAGFLPEDPAYRNTIFSPTQVRSRNRHFKSRAPATKESKTPLELDVNYFDRGMYLAAPKEEKSANDPDTTVSNTEPETVPTYDPALTFEELNYQGESAWLMRHERARRLPEEQDSKKESIFQKPKSHFKQLKLNQEAKQASAALRESSQIGSISEWKEGARLGETLSFSNEKSNISSKVSHPPEMFNLGSQEPGFVNQNKAEKRKEDFSSRERQLSPFASSNVEGQTQDLGLKEPGFLNLSGRATDNSGQRALLKELAFEKEIASAYEKSFASPFGEESDGTPPDLLPVENIIKKRYRLNPVYRALLQTDIDFFLARQPANYRITQNQEASLFKKRQLLEKYYNSIRYYSPVENVGFAKRYITRFTDGDLWQRKPFTKSFVETLYHQQFKGTLNTVKRFFKLTFDEGQNPSKNRVLSYDQPLYKNSNFSSLSKKNNAGNRLLNESSQTYHPSLHEELDLEKVSPFIEESNSTPIYAGWDEKARRFVITNRFNFIE